MKRMALCLALAACGGGSDDELTGDWASEDDEYECYNVVTFEGDVVQFKLACVLDDDSLGIEVHTGKFTDDGRSFQWTLATSSCSDPSLRPKTPQSVAHTMVGERLRLVDEDGVTVFHRASKPTGSSADDLHASFGCFDADGNFTESPIRPVR